MQVRVWDLPTRLFHWLLVAAVIGLVITSQVGGNWMTWHMRLGYTVLTLLLFRVVWGFTGGHWSRFSNFWFGPRAALRYLREPGAFRHVLGHSPLGALSVFALLAFLLAQAVTGLFVDDEIAFSGPLSRFVSNASVTQLTTYHKLVGKWVLIVLVSLHVIAVLVYLWGKRQNLIKPMISGDKDVDLDLPMASQDRSAQRITALVVLLLAGGIVWWIASLST
jgi:cytochrome b